MTLVDHLWDLYDFESLPNQLCNFDVSSKEAMCHLNDPHSTP